MARQHGFRRFLLGLWRRSDRLAGTRDGAREFRWYRYRGSDLDDLLHGSQRRGPTRPCRSPGLVRARKESSTTGCDLASWAWRRRRANARFWGDLPAVGQSRVINPDGMGRRFERFSDGYAGQIDDLAKMPDLVSARSRGFGSTARASTRSERAWRSGDAAPRRAPSALPAGAVAMDSVTDLARRYHQLPEVPATRPASSARATPSAVCSEATMREEVGGRPDQVPAAYQCEALEARFGRSRARTWRYRCGGLAATRSSSTRSTNRLHSSANCGG